MAAILTAVIDRKDFGHTGVCEWRVEIIDSTRVLMQREPYSRG